MVSALKMQIIFLYILDKICNYYSKNTKKYLNVLFLRVEKYMLYFLWPGISVNAIEEYSLNPSFALLLILSVF